MEKAIWALVSKLGESIAAPGNIKKGVAKDCCCADSREIERARLFFGSRNGERSRSRKYIVVEREGARD